MEPVGFSTRSSILHMRLDRSTRQRRSSLEGYLQIRTFIVLCSREPRVSYSSDIINTQGEIRRSLYSFMSWTQKNIPKRKCDGRGVSITKNTRRNFRNSDPGSVIIAHDQRIGEGTSECLPSSIDHPISGVPHSKLAIRSLWREYTGDHCASPFSSC